MPSKIKKTRDTAPQRGVALQRLVLPCKVPCPKCGSSDIRREHREIGDDVRIAKDDDGQKARPPYLKTNWPYGHKAKTEHIGHHCRSCQHEWEGPIRQNAEVSDR